MVTNSFSESDNSSLKRNTCGPRPNDALDTSAKKTTEHIGDRLGQLRADAENGLSQTYTESKEDCLEKTIEDRLAKFLIPTTAAKIRIQWEMSSDYTYISNKCEDLFLVRKKKYSRKESAIPRFARTREIRLVPFGNRIRLQCSCYHHIREGTSMHC